MAYLTTDDTIAAIASPTGSGQRGIVRISGPNTASIVENCFRFDGQQSRQVFQSADGAKRFTGNVDLNNQLRLPGSLVYWPDHRSYTRQPSAEFHTLGSGPLLEMAIQRICESGARLAQPGEFTLRAFLSGRMDLTQAEAVLAVIDAESTKKLSVALDQLSGGLTGPLADTKVSLMNVLAELEAGLDFVEEDIEFIASSQIISALSDAKDQVVAIENQIQKRGVDDQSFKVVLSGLPNAGKSSLFNALLGTERAIVSDLSGTTTDFVTCNGEMEGVQIQLVDTAGLETTPDDVSQSTIMTSAQNKRHAELESAQLILVCVSPDDDSYRWAIDQIQTLHRDGVEFLVVLTKSDLSASLAHDEEKRISLQSLVTATTGSQRKLIGLSSHTGENLDRLKFEISTITIGASTGENAVVSSTLIRTRESLRSASTSIAGALEAAQAEFGQEIVAAEIRQALDALGQIVGTVYNDDVLDLVFGRFCIGK